MHLPVMPPVKPMLAKSAPLDKALDLVRGGGGLVEPKWDGFTSSRLSTGRDRKSPQPEIVRDNAHVPRICAFYGIVIWMYYDDHNPPHFHATYGEHEAIIEISTWRVLRGSLPARALRLVEEWASAHPTELTEDWDRARSGRPLEPIAPLS